MRVAGADVWKGRWVVVVLEDGHFDRAFLSPTIEAVVDELTDAEVIGVDMPIGLAAPGQYRLADLEARTYVGPRRHSVFMTPSIQLLEARSHRDANELAKAQGWSGISAQAYALKAMILQVQPVAARDTRIHEVHPEVSFVQANHETALPYSKASWNGLTLRRRILADHRIILPDDLQDTGRAGMADILDAAIVAWSAVRIAVRTAEPFPDGGARSKTIWR